MNSETALALATSRMMLDSGADADTLYDYLEVLVGRRRARELTDTVIGMQTSEENRQRVEDARAAKLNAPATADVKELQRQVAELQKMIAERDRAAGANDKLMFEFKIEQLTARAVTEFEKKHKRQPTEDEVNELRAHIEAEEEKKAAKKAKR